jgi:hypothetical protein
MTRWHTKQESVSRAPERPDDVWDESATQKGRGEALCLDSSGKALRHRSLAMIISLIRSVGGSA